MYLLIFKVTKQQPSQYTIFSMQIPIREIMNGKSRETVAIVIA